MMELGDSAAYIALFGTLMGGSGLKFIEFYCFKKKRRVWEAQGQIESDPVLTYRNMWNARETIRKISPTLARELDEKSPITACDHKGQETFFAHEPDEDLNVTKCDNCLVYPFVRVITQRYISQPVNTFRAEDAQMKMLRDLHAEQQEETKRLRAETEKIGRELNHWQKKSQDGMSEITRQRALERQQSCDDCYDVHEMGSYDPVSRYHSEKCLYEQGKKRLDENVRAAYSVPEPVIRKVEFESIYCTNCSTSLVRRVGDTTPIPHLHDCKRRHRDRIGPTGNTRYCTCGVRNCDGFGNEELPPLHLGEGREKRLKDSIQKRLA